MLHGSLDNKNGRLLKYRKLSFSYGGYMMKDMSTKERIMYAALDLFSKKGCDGVGVDLIAENAGLK